MRACCRLVDEQIQWAHFVFFACTRGPGTAPYTSPPRPRGTPGAGTAYCTPRGRRGGGGAQGGVLRRTGLTGNPWCSPGWEPARGHAFLPEGRGQGPGPDGGQGRQDASAGGRAQVRCRSQCHDNVNVNARASANAGGPNSRCLGCSSDLWVRSLARHRGNLRQNPSVISAFRGPGMAGPTST